MSPSKKIQLVETKDDPRWASVVARNSNADGTFYYSIKTTGVYCRPSCSARLALPENVQFHKTCEDAERAGFRPCKRCRPNQPSLAEQHTTKITKACRFIEESDRAPSLKKLSEHVGMSMYHFHRIFKMITGLTPREYVIAYRSKRVRNEIAHSETVTDTIYDSGYSSTRRFYETSNDMLGMTPSKYRAGGTNTKIRFAVGECSLGSILVAQSNLGICAIFLGNDPEKLVRDLQDKFPHSELVGDDKKFEQIVSKVIGFVESPHPRFDLPLDIRGTAFQQRVWNALRKIPAGSTATYTDIANIIGSPNSARAVAQACASNTLAVVIPCHRVIRNDGSLSGYRWGIERKNMLLKKEASKKSLQNTSDL